MFLAYRSRHGHALIDRVLYLPRECADDAPRRAEAKLPGTVTFATKQTLARDMLTRALAAQVPAALVTADEVNGADYTFRRFCEEKRRNYVVAISSTTRLAVGTQTTSRAEVLSGDSSQYMATSVLRCRC